jgi:methyl-accepting chemotaxis protein
MIEKLSKLSIGYKVAFGFILCSLILAVSILTTVFYVKQTDAINTRLVELRIPTAKNTLNMVNGVNHSLAALRGWIILGKDKFKDQREIAWTNIDYSLEKMEEYSKNWTNPENVKTSKELAVKFKEFKKFQDEIEAIAHTAENTPATKILLDDAAPKANIMLASITELINLELKREATPSRKQILGMMADIRGTTARSLANIRAFLLSGNKVFHERFNTMWNKNIIRVNDLTAQKSNLSPEQLIQYNKYVNARNNFKDLPKKMFDIRSGESWNLANKWLGTRAAPVAFSIKELLTKMHNNQSLLMNEDGKKSTSLVQTLLNLEYALLVFGISLCGVIGFFISKSINKLLTKVTSQLSEGVEKISNLTDQITGSSQDLSSSSEQQAAAMQETSSTMDEIEAMIKRNTEDSSVSSQVATKSYEEVNAGVNKIKEMGSALNSISSSSEKVSNQVNISNEKMIEIASIIKSIGEKTQVINDIVFQTKLLSFNASVEAARAGEHGKGFAVVAEEVGNLAEMSGSASKEIYEMLESSITSVEKVANEQKQDMERLLTQTKSDISKGLSLGKESEDVLTTLLTSMNNVKESVNKIALASDEQSKGVEEVSQSISEVNDTTRTNSGIASRNSEIAAELKSSINNFKTVLEALKTNKKDNPQKEILNKEFESEVTLPKKASNKTIKESTEKTLKVTEKPTENKEAATTVVTKKAKAESLRSETSYQEIPSADDDRFEDIA